MISNYDFTSSLADQNKDYWKDTLQKFNSETSRIKLGGGFSNIEKQHAKGRLSVRERLNLLLDKDTPFFELGIFTAYEMYEEWGGCPAAGVITGFGMISGKKCMVIANDATVKAGSFFPMTAKKVIRAQKIALENRIPTVYLVDSSGIFLPLQEDVFPDTDDFGRVFYLNARMSSKGIPQITAIMGMCVAGGAYLPVMCDSLIMTEGSGLFLAGPALVKAAIGQVVDAETLGGAEMHAAISGTVDFKEKDDLAAIKRIRDLISRIGNSMPSIFNRDISALPAYDLKELMQIMPADPLKDYDMRDIIARIVDKSEFTEYKKEYGKSIVCGYARIGGYSVGIVANQKKHYIEKGRPPEFGGVIYSESAAKATRFIMDCNQNIIPLFFIHDVNGFMVGKDAEQSGIIREGAKMVNAVSNSTVPKISLIIGGTFGAGHYAMCGKAFEPRLIFAWPSARYAVMGGAQAANTLVDIRIRQMEKGGKKLSDEERKELFDTIKATYDHQTDPRYAAARLWIDEIIFPHETRDVMINALEIVTNNPEIERFNPGVIQT
ncbi:MAG: acyl-CoA carboxylase subunit beta [Calditrichales bacterium]|nr:MAG: acyl-CoA carboxylase subunit beta [Calditrichales bacterium]